MRCDTLQVGERCRLALGCRPVAARHAQRDDEFVLGLAIVPNCETLAAGLRVLRPGGSIRRAGGRVAGRGDCRRALDDGGRTWGSGRPRGCGLVLPRHAAPRADQHAADDRREQAKLANSPPHGHALERAARDACSDSLVRADHLVCCPRSSESFARRRGREGVGCISASRVPRDRVDIASASEEPSLRAPGHSLRSRGPTSLQSVQSVPLPVTRWAAARGSRRLAGSVPPALWRRSSPRRRSHRRFRQRRESARTRCLSCLGSQPPDWWLEGDSFTVRSTRCLSW